MSGFLTAVTAFSIVGLLILTFWRIRKTRNWRSFGVQLVALALCSLLLYGIFGFPFAKKIPVSRGEEGQDIFLVIVLYGFMLLGMLAQYGFHHFGRPKVQREPFDLGIFLAPIFASPIIFVPLFAALQSSNINLSEFDAPRLMLFLVAFENGFFWKDYFDHRRRAKIEEKNEPIS
jgi:hypothetical protein